MKVYFITSNHNDLKQVKEFFSYYIDNFDEFEFAFSENIVINSCNIILEEFSNNKFAEEIINIKNKYPGTIFFLLFSEHITNDPFLGFSFNYYRKMSLPEKLVYLNLTDGKFNNILSIMSRIIYKLRIKEQLIDDLKEFLIKILSVDLNEIEFCMYMKKRYLGFEKVKEVFDCIFALDTRDKTELLEHLGKKFNDKIIIILPKSDIIKRNQNFGISISGAITKYRLDILKKIEKHIKIYNNFDNFRKNTNLFFRKNIHTTYNLHIPKNKSWEFHSLLKYILAIKNNEIPIISRKIEGEIGNLLCIYVEKVSILNNKNTYENFLNNFNKNINKFNLFHEKYKKEFKEFCKRNKY